MLLPEETEAAGDGEAEGSSATGDEGRLQVHSC